MLRVQWEDIGHHEKNTVNWLQAFLVVMVIATVIFGSRQDRQWLALGAICIAGACLIALGIAVVTI